MRREGDADRMLYETWIGRRVAKVSGKPFKSTFKVNTVRSITKHHNGLCAFCFVEDESVVECWRCRLAG